MLRGSRLLSGLLRRRGCFSVVERGLKVPIAHGFLEYVGESRHWLSIATDNLSVKAVFVEVLNLWIDFLGDIKIRDFLVFFP